MSVLVNVTVFETSKSAKEWCADSDATALHRARTLGDLTVPGWRVHALQGFDPVRHSLWVNGPWRITFGWIDGDAHRVDLEQYH